MVKEIKSFPMGRQGERLMMLMMLNNKDAASGDRHKVHYMTLELARFEGEISCQERYTEGREKTDMALKSPRREAKRALATGARARAHQSIHVSRQRLAESLNRTV